MNTNIRSILSASIAVGLVSSVVISAFAFGAAAPATLVSFGLLAVYGMLEIAIVSYQAPRLISLPRASAPSMRPSARLGTVIHYPTTRREENLARAA